MGEIGSNLLLPKALKSCPKSKKSPNLVTLLARFLIVPYLMCATFVSVATYQYVQPQFYQYPKGPLNVAPVSFNFGFTARKGN